MGDGFSFQVQSGFLSRQVKVDVYEKNSSCPSSSVALLLINDGQDLPAMGFADVLGRLVHSYCRLICVGIHAGPERKQEYGVAGFPDFMQRGLSAGAYASFVLDELLPLLHQKTNTVRFDKKYLAGFSLGGLMAFDMAIDHPHQFNAVGVFSGSFWWRSKALDNGYVEERDRIMHAKLRKANHHENRKFFLQVGALDEKEDRNKNGIIDSIDDTLGIIHELENIGYRKGQDIHYLEMADGHHDTETWGRAMPVFLRWLSDLK
ncbi:MAG: esterase [Chitinophagaceae bacterium]|jgi:enterochelin esterase family protein|nr:esterase [Chitinophagaceae bacterium]